MIQKTNSTQASDNKECDTKLYGILIEELRHLHKVWIDNFRVMLSFNSLVLPASFALLILITRGELDKDHYLLAYLLLICLATIGNIVTVTSLVLIRRVVAITRLRQHQVRRLEIIICESISVTPFLEGYSLYGGLIDSNTLSKITHAYQQPNTFRLGKLNCLFGYGLIGGSFCVAYCIVFVTGMLGIIV